MLGYVEHEKRFITFWPDLVDEAVRPCTTVACKNILQYQLF